MGHLGMCRTGIACVILGTAVSLGGCCDSATKEKLAQESGVVQPGVSRWDGQLIRRPGSTPEDGKVFLVKDGERRWVKSGDWLKLHGYRLPDDVHVISASELAEIPEVSNWEGQLIRRPGPTPEDGKIFLVKDGERHWVMSGDWLKLHGYRLPDDVRVISASELAQMPEGERIH